MAPYKRDTVPGTVNIIGLPISARHWEDAYADLKNLISVMGLKVISSPGAGCSSEDIEKSVSAEFNIVVSPEYCVETAKLYEREYGIPAVFCKSGAPSDLMRQKTG